MRMLRFMGRENRSNQDIMRFMESPFRSFRIDWDHNPACCAAARGATRRSAPCSTTTVHGEGEFQLTPISFSTLQHFNVSTPSVTVPIDMNELLLMAHVSFGVAISALLIMGFYLTAD